MHDRHDTEPSPADDTPTNPDGIPDAERAAADLLSPEAALRLIPRLIAGVEALGRDLLRAVDGLHLAIDRLSAQQDLAIREGQLHAQRLSDLERRVAALRCQSGGDCDGCAE